MHDDISLKAIMKDLAKAGLVSMLKDAPVPSSATANAAAETIEQLTKMTGNILCKHMMTNQSPTMTWHME